MRRIRISVFRRSASFIYFLACRKFCLAEHDREGSRIHRRRLPAKISVLTFVLGNGLAKLGRGCVARTRALAPSAPATAGEGDHWSSRSERTVVEGALESELRFLCKRFSLQEEASEHVWTSPRLLRRVEACAPSTALRAVPLPRFAGADELRRVESCAPSTTLLRRVVPLPRFRGGGKRRHIFNKRFALPLRIFALSSSDSGTVCIQSSAGGFMTNGQSTANRI
jgi:hypothetical protein